MMANEMWVNLSSVRDRFLGDWFTRPFT